MAKETVVETKTVEEEREVKVCDYCRLMSSDDIDEDEEFKEILLNPEVDITDPNYYVDEESLEKYGKVENEDDLRDVIDDLFEWFSDNYVTLHTENTADLCPQCADELFGEEAPSGIRAGTGFLEEDNVL